MPIKTPRDTAAPEQLAPNEDAGRRDVVAAAAVFAGVAGCAVVGGYLSGSGVSLMIGTAVSLSGRWDPSLSAYIAIPSAIGIAWIVAAPMTSRRLAWRSLLGLSTVVAAGWTVSLALVGSGLSGLTRPLESRHDYLHDVPRVGGLVATLRTFVEHVPAGSPDAWTTHVAGHPPGVLLAFAGLDRLGLGGSAWAAAFCIAAGVLAVPAVLITFRSVADEAMARRAVPFLVLAPYATWIATSADAAFLGVSAWGICLLTLGAATRGARADALCAAGGVLLGLSLFGSYGLVLVGVIAIAFVLMHRNLRALILGALGVALVVGAFAAAGFWWLDGFLATAQRVADGPAATNRPMAYFVVANLAAAAIALGPAAAGGLARIGIPRRAADLLPLAGLAAILLADLSGLSKGEVERIWLPFYPWILVAAADLPASRSRPWLAAQVVLALAIPSLVLTAW